MLCREGRRWFLIVLFCVAVFATVGDGRARSGRGHRKNQLPGGVRRRPREKVPCLSSQCKCRYQSRAGGVIAQCDRVAESLPSFSPQPVEYTEVQLIARNLTSINNDAFLGVKTLRLDLSENLFSQGLSDGAFRGLESTLEVLVLSESCLREVPVNCITPLTRLTDLELQGNNFTRIAPYAFSSLANLRNLYLYRNQLTILDAFVFAGLEQLEDLKIDQNALHNLPKRIFSNLSSLVSLDFSRNLISSFPKGLFRSLSDMQWLDISYNRLTSLNKSTFSGLSSLKNLKVEGNPLLQIAINTFKSIARLKDLTIDLGGIRDLNDETLSHLTRMSNLDIGEVNRSALPTGLLATTRKLRFLTLANSNGIFQGLDPGVFMGTRPRGQSLFRLQVFVTPLDTCKCRGWVKGVTDLGATIFGYCKTGRAITCVSTAPRVRGRNRRKKGRKRAKS